MMSFSKIISVSILFVVLLSPGCETFKRRQVNREPNAIQMPVFEDMVKNADESGKLLCIVDLSPPQIEQLRQSCGRKCQIVSALDSDGHKQDGKKTSEQDKVHIRVKIVRVNGIWAEASGAYVQHLSDGFVSLASFRYKLRYKNGQWCVISCEFYAAS